MTGILSRLVYSSRSLLKGTAEECLAEVADILRASRANNPKAGLTGVLLFDGTNFLQVLEGPIAEIERLHETITCDRRHEDITLIDLVSIETRDYDAWSMAFLDGTDTRHHILRRFLAKQSGPDAAGLGSTLSGALRALLLQATSGSAVSEHSDQASEEQADGEPMQGGAARLVAKPCAFATHIRNEEALGPLGA